MARRKLVFITRGGCGLCDEALPHVRMAARYLFCRLSVVQLSDNPEWEAAYHLRIPVVLDGKDQVVAEGNIGRREALLAALKSWR